MAKNKSPMTPDAVARIEKAEAKRNDGKIPEDSFAGRAQRTIAKNHSQEKTMSNQNPNYPSKTGEPSGSRRGNTPKR